MGVDASGYFELVGDTAKYPEIYRRYAGRPPLLTLTEADHARGRAALARLGIPADAWFVCVHCREAGFYDDDVHDYRNASIANFAEAMATITAAGGWCVRMGDPSMTPLAPAPQRRRLRAPRRTRAVAGSVPRWRRSRFFLGTSSGLLGVAAAFGVPAGLTNQAPMSVVLPIGDVDVGIPKLNGTTSARGGSSRSPRFSARPPATSASRSSTRRRAASAGERSARTSPT